MGILSLGTSRPSILVVDLMDDEDDEDAILGVFVWWGTLAMKGGMNESGYRASP